MLENQLTPTKSKPAQGKWTYEDYLALPDDGQRYEIIEGNLHKLSIPTIKHQFSICELARQMGNFVIEHNLGFVLVAPFEVHLSEKTRPVQPDVLFIKTKNWPGRDVSFFAGVPDLVVEVISPSSIRRDQHIKFSAYEKARVPEYWLLDPKTRSSEIFTLSGAEYALLGQFINDEIIQSAVLEGLEIINSSLFIK